MSIEIRVPALGESVTEATVGKWFKQAGESVNADEPLVELETDKVTVEVPAPASGVLGDILVKSGSTVAVGSLLAALKGGAAKTASVTAPQSAPSEEPKASPPPPRLSPRQRSQPRPRHQLLAHLLRRQLHEKRLKRPDWKPPTSTAPAGAGRF